MRCALVGSRTNTNLLATGLIQPPLAVMPAVPRRPERPLVVLCRLGYSSPLSSHGLRQEVIMADPARRAKLVRDLEQDFVPDYDAQNALGRQAGGLCPRTHRLPGRPDRAEPGADCRRDRVSAVEGLTRRPLHGGRPSHFVIDVLANTSSNGLQASLARPAQSSLTLAVWATKSSYEDFR